MTGTWLLNSAEQTLNYHGYEHNLRNDITHHTRTDASFVDYAYDDLGQLTDAVGSGGSRSPVRRRQRFGVRRWSRATSPIFWRVWRWCAGRTLVRHTKAVEGCRPQPHSKTLARGSGSSVGSRRRFGVRRWSEADSPLSSAAGRGCLDEHPSGMRKRQRDSPTTALQNAGARIGKSRAKLQTFTYTRGNDLSGSLEGAGGIGGMMARSHGYSGSTGNWSTHNYYHADAGGNITCLINAGQSITASYRYDPFGRTLFQSGTMANANVYRFSSKEVHGFTGMYYYGFRFYDPGLQRWINRDPIGEHGGINLYTFVDNSPYRWIDKFGLAPFDEFDTMDAAACDALKLVFDLTRQNGVEYGGWLFKTKAEKFSYTTPQKGEKQRVEPGPKPPTARAVYHSHTPGPGAEDFSDFPGDKWQSDRSGFPFYLVTPSGNMLRYDPDPARQQKDPVTCIGRTGSPGRRTEPGRGGRIPEW